MISSESSAGDRYFTGQRTLYSGSIAIVITDFDLEEAKNLTVEMDSYLRLLTSIRQGNTYFKRIKSNGYYHVKSSNQEGSMYSINLDIKYQR